MFMAGTGTSSSVTSGAYGAVRSVEVALSRDTDRAKGDVDFFALCWPYIDRDRAKVDVLVLLARH